MALRTLCYRQEPRPLYLDVHAPNEPSGDATRVRTRAPVPVIVFFFGGGWRNGQRQQFLAFAEHAAARGMCAVLADYRIESLDGTTPVASVSDAKSVMRFLRKHAGDLGIDPDQIVAAGGSAGGHIAAAACCVERWDHPQDDVTISAVPQALALFNPVIHNGPGQYGYERVADYYLDISPFHRVHAAWPPTTIMLGTEDALIPLAMMREFAASIRALGARCDEHYYPEQGHGFFNYNDGQNPYYKKTVQVLDDFLVSLRMLKACDNDAE